jgi:hypothetical protein
MLVSVDCLIFRGKQQHVERACSAKGRPVNIRLLLAGAVVSAFLSFPLLSAGVADAAVVSPGQHAVYRGHSFEMSKGWGTAQSCAVISKAEVRCFDSNQEADEYLVKMKLSTPQPSSTFAASSVPACADGWMCLFADANGGGRRLIFRDEGWQSLVPYGFQQQTSSVRNNQPSADLGCISNGYTLNPPCWGGRTYASQLGIYDNWAMQVGA